MIRSYLNSYLSSFAVFSLSQDFLSLHNTKTKNSPGRCEIGEPADVGVTEPADFLVRRLLKKLANAPSFGARVGSPGVVI